MLDFADVVAINKFDRRGGEDALRDVRRQMVRNREAFAPSPTTCRCSAPSPPASTTTASPPSTRSCGTGSSTTACSLPRGHAAPGRRPDDLEVRDAIVPPASRPLPGRGGRGRSAAYHAATAEQAAAARQRQAARPSPRSRSADRGAATADLEAGADRRRRAGAVARPSCRSSTPGRPPSRPTRGDEHVTRSRDRELRTKLTRESLSGTIVPRVALPRYHDDGDLLRFLREENLPGRFPFTAGVFPFKRDGEGPARMFAGEGDAFRTNRRFHLLAEGQPATRLSTAFDSVTLYGFDPDQRPDIYGKVGNSGVSIATLDDMKVLFDGFDLCDPTTSVSMTINGPAPDDPRHVPEHGDRPAPRRVRGGAGPAADRRGGGRAAGRCSRRPGHGAGRHPQGGPGPEHLHLLHRVRPRDDGRHPGVVRRAPGAELLQRLDLRLPHRRGGREPHQPAGLHPGQRVHLRRGLPGPGHGRRRLRPQPLVLLLQRDGPRVHGASAGSPGASGPSPCATATAPTSAARS